MDGKSIDADWTGTLATKLRGSDRPEHQRGR